MQALRRRRHFTTPITDKEFSKLSLAYSDISDENLLPLDTYVDEDIMEEEFKAYRSEQFKELHLHIQKLEESLEIQQNEFQKVEMEKTQIEENFQNLTKDYMNLSKEEQSMYRKHEDLKDELEREKEAFADQLSELAARAEDESRAKHVAEEDMAELETEKMMLELELQEIHSKHKSQLSNLEIQLTASRDTESDLRHELQTFQSKYLMLLSENQEFVHQSASKEIDYQILESEYLDLKSEHLMLQSQHNDLQFAHLEIQDEESSAGSNVDESGFLNLENPAQSYSKEKKMMEERLSDEGPSEDEGYLNSSKHEILQSKHQLLKSQFQTLQSENQNLISEHQENLNFSMPGQSLILNPEDPNSASIYPCGKCQCEVHVEEQAIICQAGCDFWYHLNCTDLSQFAYEQLCNIPNSLFVCDSCLKTDQEIHLFGRKVYESTKSLEKLQSELQKLQDEHQKHGFKHEDLQSEHKDVENSLDEVEHGFKTNYQILQCRFNKSQDQNKILQLENAKYRATIAEFDEEITTIKKTKIDSELKSNCVQSELSAKNQHLEVEIANLKKVVKEKILENEDMKKTTEAAKNENNWLLLKSAEISQQNSHLKIKLTEQELLASATESELRAEIDYTKNVAEEKQNELKASLEESNARAQHWYHQTEELSSEKLDLESQLKESKDLLDDKIKELENSLQFFSEQWDSESTKYSGLGSDIGGNFEHSDSDLDSGTEESKEPLSKNLGKSDLELKFLENTDSDHDFKMIENAFENAEETPRHVLEFFKILILLYCSFVLLYY